jgi:hypothetical protein
MMIFPLSTDNTSLVSFYLNKIIVRVSSRMLFLIVISRKDKGQLKKDGLI